MANEILVLDTPGATTDGTFTNLGFFYSIAAPKIVVSGQTVIVSAVSTLPALARQGVTSAQSTALSVGSMAFEAVSFFYDGSATTAAVQAQARAEYAVRYQRFVTDYARRYKNVGFSFSSL